MGRVSGKKGRPADPEREAIKGRLRGFLKSSGGAYRLYHGGDFAEGTVKNWMAGRGSLPNVEQAVRLAEHTALSLDWLVTGKGSPTRTGGGGALDAAAQESVRAALEGLAERLPLRAHLVFECRTLSVVAVKLGAALAERRRGTAAVESYRHAGRLLGECIAAPLGVLGVADLPPQDGRIAQAYVSAMAHAVEILAHYARPVAAKPRNPRRPAKAKVRKPAPRKRRK